MAYIIVHSWTPQKAIYPKWWDLRGSVEWVDLPVKEEYLSFSTVAGISQIPVWKDDPYLACIFDGDLPEHIGSYIDILFKMYGGKFFVRDIATGASDTS